MKAIILAAGIGSRISSLTDNCPKSLLKIDDKTILEMMISHMLRFTKEKLRAINLKKIKTLSKKLAKQDKDKKK